jgi:transcriptional regulator of heat shock response
MMKAKKTRYIIGHSSSGRVPAQKAQSCYHVILLHKNAVAGERN